MTSVLEQSAAVEKQHDLSNPAEGGFTRELPEAGAALLRLQTYMELGYHQPSNKTWKPAILCKFTFELLHPKHMIKPEGKPDFPQTLTIDVWKAPSKGSRYMKLFDAMNYEGTHVHFDTMIGKTPFLGGLTHRDNGKTGNDKRTYVNMTNDQDNWWIGAPRIEDPMTGDIKEIPIPEMHQEGKLFLWKEPGWSDELTKLAWDTLFIETPEGEEKSRNWIQERIQEALDYKGSPLEGILAGEVLPQELTNDEPPLDPVAEANQTEKKTSADVDTSDADALASLGL